MLEQHQKDLEHLLTLYANAKLLILEAEGKDPEQKSNIAVINEIRAALDHLMQCLGVALSGEPETEALRKENEVFIEGQIRKAKEHIIRVSYDSLDGIGVSIHKRLSEMLHDLSESSIAVSFPEYHSDYLSKITNLDEKIIESRAQRDSRRVNSEEKIKEYEAVIREMEFIYGEIGINLRHIANYDRSSKFDAEMRKFSQKAIVNICPRYYNEYHKQSTELKRMLAQKTFKKEKEKYEELVKIVNDMQDEMKTLFPEMTRFDKYSAWRKIQNILVPFLSAALGALITALIAA